LRLAPELKRLGIKVIYYISPQVWAWKENRVEIIRANVDKMLVLFKFEKDFYQKHGLGVEFVGHPLIDDIRIKKSKLDFLHSIGLSDDKLTIGLLPGSRRKEIENLLPPMLEAAQILHYEFPRIQFLLLKAPSISHELLATYSSSYAPLPLKIIDSQTYDGIHASDLCIVASGTATLETAIIGKPMVVVYKTAHLTYWIAKRLVKIPYIAMANVVAGKKIIPECIQGDANGKKIAAELREIFTDEIKIVEIKSELAKVRLSLGEGGAAQRAAEAVLKLI
jgi:lipid-A-disaccharide synthase